MNCAISLQLQGKHLYKPLEALELIYLLGNNLFKIYNFAVTCMRDGIEKNWLGFREDNIPIRTLTT